MKKSVLFGLTAGIAAVSAAVFVGKISKEIKNDLVEEEFDSPFGNNWIKISFGSSKTAKGLAWVKIHAETEYNEDVCNLVIFAKNCESLPFEWLDNDHFRLFVGNGKRRQCCDVVFDMKKITMIYYITKE